MMKLFQTKTGMKMAHPNARRILSRGVSLDTFKFLAMAAAASRPRQKKLCARILQPFARAGEVPVHFSVHGRRLTAWVRMSQLESDWMSVYELGIRKIYRLDPEFAPELIVDGGGNTGIFTLTAASTYPAAKIVICEPVPHNLAQIQKHLERNRIRAQVLPVCIGGAPRNIRFYVREANQGSFDAGKPYESTIEVEVVTLASLVRATDAQRILIKLDIEGMELEALASYVPEEKRAVCVIGELHDHKANAAELERIFRSHGWTVNFDDVGDAGSNFDAWSPAAINYLAREQAVSSAT